MLSAFRARAGMAGRLFLAAVLLIGPRARFECICCNFGDDWPGLAEEWALEARVLPEQFVKFANSPSAIIRVAALNSLSVGTAVVVLSDFLGVDGTT